MLIVPFLKITVSGLITTGSAPAHTGVQVALETIFNTTTIFPLDDKAPGAEAKMFLPFHTLALSQIEKYGLKLPAWTTSVGAVGHTDLSQLGPFFATPDTTLTVPLPVMRGDLENCAPLTGAELILLPTNEVQLPLPATAVDSEGTSRCVYSNRINVNAGAPENATFTLPASPGWFGRLYNEWCGGYVIIYGNTEAGNSSVIDQITVVQCTSYSLTM
jgi:hypothetical protein